MTIKDKKIVILYHAECRDGFSAAWAAWKKFGKTAFYIPVTHYNPPPTGLKNKEIYFLDFVYPMSTMVRLIRSNKRVTAIDHHISAEKITKITKDWRYAVNHSGAALAWRYFHPGKKTPIFLKCVEDSDIWKWTIPSSREILAYVDLTPMNFENWNKISRDLEILQKRKKYIAGGKLLIRYYDKLVNDFVMRAEKVEFLGSKVYAANVPGYFRDDVGHILAEKLNSFAIVWREENGRIRVSLRSSGSVDVSKIAGKFGGGGHHNAAAFSFPAGRKFPWKLIL